MLYSSGEILKKYGTRYNIEKLLKKKKYLN